jgi:Ca-activated chloride channel family protein
VFHEERPEGTYALALVVPPSGAGAKNNAPAVAREEIFVVDTSGSMAGGSLAQAKESLRFALSTLRPDDRFNIIQFNSVTSRLFDTSEMAFPDTLQKALAYVDQLVATGGTEMRPALELALEEPPQPGRPLRQVVFMTDGSVGNEDELFGYIREHLADARLFTVGIGSAPNAHFLRQAAEFGRGSFTSVGSPQQVAERMGALLRKLGAPALTDLEMGFDDLAAEAWPARLPDLYLGEPVTVAVLLPKGGGLHLHGTLGTAPWLQDLALAPGGAKAVADTPALGIEKLWARRKIGALTDAEIEGKDAAAVRAEVTAVALEHHLVSQFTSLVAVDVTPTAPPGPVKTVELPVDLPAGWVFEDVWGEMPSTATPRDLLLVAGLAFGVLGFALRCGGRS